MAFQYCEPSDFSDFTPYSTIEVAARQIKDEAVKAEMLRAIEMQKAWNKQQGIFQQVDGS